MNRAHSNSETGLSRPVTNINVRFVSISPIQLSIKNSNAMKALTVCQNQNNSIIPGLFQIAAQFEGHIMATIVNPASAIKGKTITQKEFAEVRREAVKSSMVESLKSQSKMPPMQACGWSLPIRK
jgi:hypothetical protein